MPYANWRRQAVVGALVLGGLALLTPHATDASPSRFREARKRAWSSWNNLRRPGTRRPAGTQALRTGATRAGGVSGAAAGATRGVVRRAPSRTSGLVRSASPSGRPPGAISGRPRSNATATRTQWAAPMDARGGAAPSTQGRGVVTQRIESRKRGPGTSAPQTNRRAPAGYSTVPAARSSAAAGTPGYTRLKPTATPPARRDANIRPQRAGYTEGPGNYSKPPPPANYDEAAAKNRYGNAPPERTYVEAKDAYFFDRVKIQF